MSAPVVTVVAATKDRPDRLAALLESLERQGPGTPAFSVVVVDDGSGDETRRVLDAAAAGSLDLRVVRHERSRGPAAARNAGWRAADGALVGFTDDDCEVEPDWIARAVAAWDGRAERFVQGATGPIPRERDRLSPFARTIVVQEPGPPWETCNIFFPRALLERLDGFDERFPLPGGEDTDLAWRAVLDGAEPVFDAGVQAHHAVLSVGPLGMLRYAWHWHATVPLFARHPDLKRRQLHRGVFWSPVHEEVLLLLAAAVVPRRAWPVRVLLATPYLRRRLRRRSGPVLLPFLLAVDLVEVAAMVRGAVRDRTLVL